MVVTIGDQMDKAALYDLYASDPSFIATYHGHTDWTIDQCVNDSWKVLESHERYLFDWGYFSIDRDGDLVPRLGGFFLKPGFRTPEVKTCFYKELCDRMPKIFLGSLNNNSSALNFLKKLPGSEIITTTDKYTYFCFRQEK